MLTASSRDTSRLVSGDDVEQFTAELSVGLHATGDELAARLDRGVRRMVFALSAVMVASAAVTMLVARLAS